MDANNRRWWKKPTVITAGLLLLAVVALVGWEWTYPQQHTVSINDTPALAEAGVIRPADIADVVEKVAPSVVKIETVVKSTVYYDNPFLNDPFFREFFGDQLPRSSTQVRTGLGSGFIVSEEGYIVTNEHVIEGATEINVVLSTNKTYPAQLVAADEKLDLAVIKIDAKEKLPALEFGNSDKVRVGDWVIAIGNPYGLDHTVTVGVISAKGRPVTIENRRFQNLLQTDASINPGNSGGPLIDLNGRVIGVNTAVNASAQGIGFAIPSSTAASVYNQLVTKGSVDHPYLGVSIQATQDNKGVLVAGVEKGSAADKAGIITGDVILKFNNKSLSTPQDLMDAVAATQPGDKVPVYISRGGKTQNIDIIMGSKS